jgi:hypothetical protein
VKGYLSVGAGVHGSDSVPVPLEGQRRWRERVEPQLCLLAARSNEKSYAGEHV